MRLLLITVLVAALVAPAAALADRSSSERSASTVASVVAKKKGKQRGASFAAAAKLKAAQRKAARVKAAKLSASKSSSSSSSSSVDEREVKGAITAISAGSITVGTFTCKIPTGVSLSPLYALGSVVEAKCDLVGGDWTLRRLHLEDDATDEREVKGTISALSSTSITVGTLTCGIPTGVTLSSAFTTGTFVELKCKLVGTAWTLDEIEREDDGHASSGSDDDDDDDEHESDDDDDDDDDESDDD